MSNQSKCITSHFAVNRLLRGGVSCTSHEEHTPSEWIAAAGIIAAVVCVVGCVVKIACQSDFGELDL